MIKNRYNTGHPKHQVRIMAASHYQSNAQRSDKGVTKLHRVVFKHKL